MAAAAIHSQPLDASAAREPTIQLMAFPGGHQCAPCRMWVAEARREQVASLPAAHVSRERKEALGYRAAKPGRHQGQLAARRPGQAAGLQ